MSLLFATAGSRIYIGAPLQFANGAGTYPEAMAASDFDGMTWTQIGGVTNLGAGGDTAELIESVHIDGARVRKAKGARNGGSMTLVADLDLSDAGQLALVAAEKEEDTYAFRIVLNDAPAGGTPSERLFVALVMGVNEELNEANSVMKLNATLEIDSNFVRILAAA